MKTKFFKLFLVFLFILVISLVFIIILNNKVMPLYLSYSEGRMESVVTTVINKAVSECYFDDELFIMKKDSSGTMMVDYDPLVLNRIISNISSNVYDNMKKIFELDEKTINKYNLDPSIFYIPSGIIFNSVLLNNIGPKIPVKLELISSINPNIETKVTEYGINNSLIEVNIRVSVMVKMILPTSSKDIRVTVIVPLTVKIIQGNIPEYYFGSFKKSN